MFVKVDPSGPLATLRKLLLSDESLATVRRWVADHWYAAALIILGAISLLVSIKVSLKMHDENIISLKIVCVDDDEHTNRMHGT